MKIYDLRSDTVTRPTEEMRKAIYEAEVGDDVYGEDPTVAALEDTAARITGKESAILLTSGTMGNLIPLYLNCGRGNEFLIDQKGHILHHEKGAFSVIAGCLPVPLPGKKGILTTDLFQNKLKPDVYSATRPALIAVENTHNLAGGTCYSIEKLEEIFTFAGDHSLKVHMDGARVFNSSVSTGTAVGRICSCTHTVSFCLSKGLGAPAGSILCGTKDFIKEARGVRKMLGGGMRQAGILAAAGLYALKNNINRLEEDHGKAKRLAAALAETKWAQINPADVETNILFFSTPGVNAAEISQALKHKGVLANAPNPGQVRMVAHLDISDEETDEVCEIIKQLDIGGES